MIYKEVEFIKDYKALDKIERVFEDKVVAGKKRKVVVMVPIGDSEGNTKPKMKETWKVIHKKGSRVVYAGGLANDVIKMGYAKEISTLIPRKVKIPVDLKGQEDAIVKLGVDALRNQKPRPTSNKIGKGPQSNK